MIRLRSLRSVAVLLLLLVVFVGPILIVLLNALAARWAYPAVLPEEWSLRGVRFVLRNARDLISSILSSFMYSITVVVLSFIVCIAPARVLARDRFPGRRILEALFLSPVLIPAITYGMGIHFLFIRLGLANRTVGVVLVLTAASYPYMLRALIAGFEQIHRDYETCASNLGAGWLRRTMLVTIPMLLPAIVAGSTVVFLVAFSDYFLVFLIGGGAVRSFTGFLFPFLSAGDRTIGSTLTLLFVLIPIMLFVVLELTVRRFYATDSPRYNGSDGSQTDSSPVDRVGPGGPLGTAP